MAHTTHTTPTIPKRPLSLDQFALAVTHAAKRHNVPVQSILSRSQKKDLAGIRREIALHLYCAGHSISAIARRMGRDASTVKAMVSSPQRREARRASQHARYLRLKQNPRIFA